MRGNCRKAWANIDVLLKQRHDEIPKLIDTCKEFMKFESKVLEKLTYLRSRFDNAKNRNEKALIENDYNRIYYNLRARIEDYPELKAHEKFNKLMDRISHLESQISDRRETYNDAVNIYNINIGAFPELIVAKTFIFPPRDYLSKPEM